MMSSRLLLLVLAALAACQCSGRSQGDPIPSSLVDLVLNSPISSMDDLKRLLDVEFVEEDDEKPENENHANQTHRRFSRSLSVQVAQMAMCKVRTEVMEVTRAMLDKRNTNFKLWPPCVEVQRCSGCCNSHLFQCVPVARDTRHLQMTKIQFVDKRPVYEKVIIPVEDHVTCSCQPHHSPNFPRIQTTALPPPRPHPKLTAPKRQSKDELHRHDELKNNQRLHLEDKETHELQWQSKYTLSHTQGYQQSPSQHALTPAGTVNVYKGVVPTRQTTLGAPHMMSDETQTEEVGEHRGKPEHHTHVGSGDGTTVKMPTVGQHYNQSHHDEQQSKPQQPHLQTTPQQQKHNPTHDSIQSEHSVPNSGQLDPISHTYSHVEVIGQSSGLSEVLSDHQSEVSKHHRHQSEAINDQNKPQEQEMEKHQEETQHHLRHQHHHHQHHHTTQGLTHQQTTQQTVTKAPRTTPSAPQTPPPLQPPRKRRRKHRRRMSKASMRAMIM
ncbi:Platelet-derived growth factor subunit B [Triplophysa tibetana]|uniref:Platelet-derived growth factor subunit B n=1 Tax=Triplophysa tibetana TaxID=1572043 RepID=A0A5A9NQT8_9TELE|nr:Platelet-derived growth factor subunit B [Triplophysa tibetana]